jgi:hypothetical protein
MSGFSQVVAESCRQLIRAIAVLTEVLGQADHNDYQLEAAKSGVRAEVDHFLQYLTHDFHTPFFEWKQTIVQNAKCLQYDLQDVDSRFYEAPNKQDFLSELRVAMGGYIREIGMAAKTLSTMEENERRTLELLNNSRASLNQCLQAVKIKDNETFSYELR